LQKLHNASRCEIHGCAQETCSDRMAGTIVSVEEMREGEKTRFPKILGSCDFLYHSPLAIASVVHYALNGEPYELSCKSILHGVIELIIW
jgi:hypothetical protein